MNPALFIILFPILRVVVSINMLGMEVPEQMIIGQSAKMRCDYDLEGSELYSVKWYKNGLEFYRFMPRDSRKTTIFPQKGISIDLLYCDGHQVYFPHVGLQSGGIYRCEVSTEAPDFDTISRSVPVKVAALPQGPILTGFLSMYTPGDVFDGNCSIVKSIPETHLVWYVNGSPIPLDEGREMFLPSARTKLTTSINQNGFISSTLNLVLKLRQSHFEDGRVKIKCTAMLEDFFIKSNEKSLEMVRSNFPHQQVRGVISRRDNYMIKEEVGMGDKKLFSEGDSTIFQDNPFISSSDRLYINVFVLLALIVLYQQF